MGGVTGHLADGDDVRTGDLDITALFTPGHSPGHLSFLIDDCCFTADVLFKDTVGGTHARLLRRACTIRSWTC